MNQHGYTRTLPPERVTMRPLHVYPNANASVAETTHLTHSPHVTPVFFSESRHG